mmetsp:Transcript_9234/g.14646  ORF Transcript_9234/g.14646 Transcript_9234/m.14646 type:complete len:89 (+) Transcript_9234:368-634(+)
MCSSAVMVDDSLLPDGAFSLDRNIGAKTVPETRCQEALARLVLFLGVLAPFRHFSHLTPFSRIGNDRKASYAWWALVFRTPDCVEKIT